MKISRLLKMKIVPFMLLLLGFIILMFINNIYISAPFFILGVVMIVDKIWPEVK